MKHCLPRLSALLLVLLGSLAAAQDAQPERVPSRPKAMGRPGAAAPLEFTVTGLTPENAATVDASLMGLTTEVFACEACDFQKAKAGECPKCQGPLASQRAPLFSAATASGSTVQLTLSGNGPVRYSEIEAALGKHSIAVDAEHFLLTGRLMLHLKGDQAAAGSIQKNLAGSKLFQNVVAVFDDESGEIRCAVRPMEGATLAALRSALAQGSNSMSDITWMAGGKRAAKGPGRGGKGRAKGKDKDGDEDEEDGHGDHGDDDGDHGDGHGDHGDGGHGHDDD